MLKDCKNLGICLDELIDVFSLKNPSNAGFQLAYLHADARKTGMSKQCVQAVLSQGSFHR